MASAPNCRGRGAPRTPGGGDCQSYLRGSPRIFSAILRPDDAGFTMARQLALTFDQTPRSGWSKEHPGMQTDRHGSNFIAKSG